MNKEYYFYMDEGGLIGNAYCLIAEYFLIPKEDTPGHISNYYFGKLSVDSIKRIIELFGLFLKNYHPKTEINVTALTEEKSFEILEEITKLLKSINLE